MDLVRARDLDALAGLYDGHAAGVKEYCAPVCDPDHVHDATLATFVGFLGQLASAEADVNLDELLWRAMRAERFRQAQGAFAREPREQPSGEIRRARPKIARGHTPAE